MVAKRRRSLMQRENLTWKLMLTPSLLVLVLISIYPSLYNIYNSLFSWNFAKGKPRVFVGLGNYVDTLMDSNFRVAMWNTIVLVVSAVAVEFILGFLIAHFFNKLRKGGKIMRALYITPTMIAPIVASLMWLLMYNSDYGIIKYFFTLLGIANPPALLANKTWAMPAIVLVDVWQWTPFVMLVLYAGLTAIPKELNEACSVDGANGYQRFIHITLPSMKAVIAVVLLMRVMDTFKFFEAVYMLTKGGPGNATETMSYYAYKIGFSFFEVGKSSAVCLIILVIVTLACRVLNRLIADDWNV